MKIFLLILAITFVLNAGTDCGNSGKTHGLELELDYSTLPCADYYVCNLDCSKINPNCNKKQLIIARSDNPSIGEDNAYYYTCVERTTWETVSQVIFY